MCIIKEKLTWIIHKSRLLQMRGTGCKAVVIFLKSMHIIDIKTKKCSSPFFYE